MKRSDPLTKPLPEYLTRPVARFRFTAYAAMAGSTSEYKVLEWTSTRWVVQKDEPDCLPFPLVISDLSRWVNLEILEWAGQETRKQGAQSLWDAPIEL